MKKIFSIIFSVSILAFVTNVYADGHKHPVTGEMLADDQTFTYWALDEHSSIDPQIVEDVSGSDIIRDLFELPILFWRSAKSKLGNPIPPIARPPTLRKFLLVIPSQNGFDWRSPKKVSI